MRKLGGVLIVLAIALALGLSTSVAVTNKDLGNCPITGKPATEQNFLTVNGEAVHFCCENCPKAYEKQLAVKDEGPDKCPVSGQPAKAETRQLHMTSEAVHFCCENCPKTFAKKLEKDRGLKIVDKGPDKCPISGRPAVADSFIVHNNSKVYFCCENCPKAYLKNHGVVMGDPGKCPVSGKPAVAEQFAVVDSAKAVYFCCENCPKEYAKKHFQKKAE